jgi:phage repressor protein C with HTH and peptisase S24 domain|nr:MAG TPA: putative transcriptional regulator [Caudoviricetes sp.]
MSEIKERLVKFLQHKGIGQLAFENACSLSRGFVNKIGDSITVRSQDRIKNAFPELNMNWLKVGVGSMLVTDPGDSEKTLEVPVMISESESEEDEIQAVNWVYLLPISAQGGSLNDFVVSVKDSDCEKVISPIAGADYAITIAGDSMAPEYPNGSQILIKKINERAFIDWGKAYVLDTCNGVVVKILVPSKRDGYVRCLSLNPDPMYAPFEVALEDLFGVYRVMLCMSVK